MIYQWIIVNVLAPIFLHNEEKQRTLKELSKTRKNIFQRFSHLVDEIMFDEDQTILEHSGAKGQMLWREQERTKEYKKEKLEIIEKKNKCMKTKIPEWMIKSLILDYDDLLKFERSFFDLINYQSSSSSIFIALS